MIEHIKAPRGLLLALASLLAWIILEIYMVSSVTYQRWLERDKKEERPDWFNDPRQPWK